MAKAKSSDMAQVVVLLTEIAKQNQLILSKLNSPATPLPEEFDRTPRASQTRHPTNSEWCLALFAASPTREFRRADIAEAARAARRNDSSIYQTICTGQGPGRWIQAGRGYWKYAGENA